MVKHTRHKFIRRWLNYYKTHFQIEPPYIVLIDGTFCFEALKWKILIDEQIKSYLETADVRLMTTLCAIKETELLGPLGHGPMLILKQYQIFKCNHYPLISAEKCIEQLLAKEINKNFFIASQSLSLRTYIRAHYPSLPTLLITHNSINLERPSDISHSYVNETQTAKLNLTKYEQDTLKQIKQDVLPTTDEKPKPKRKKIQEPNPLARKKKKLMKPNKIAVIKHKRKTKRRKMRMAPHVREYLKNLQQNFSIKDYFQIKQINGT